MWNSLKSVFSASEKLLFSFFIINQYCTPKMFYFKNVCSKQVRICFLIYEVTFVTRKMCVQNKQWGGGLRFSPLSDFCKTKNLCSKQVGDYFLVY